jgi:hypothetical protein
LDETFSIELFAGTSAQVNEDEGISADAQLNDFPCLDGRGGGGQTFSLTKVVEIGGGNIVYIIRLKYRNENSILF